MSCISICTVVIGAFRLLITPPSFRVRPLLPPPATVWSPPPCGRLVAVVAYQLPSCLTTTTPAHSRPPSRSYGYEGIETLCTSPRGLGYGSSAFFVFFVLVGALVMLNLFIGVITTSMEEAKADMDGDALVDTKLRKIRTTRGITAQTIKDYRMVFDTLDTDAGGSLDSAELRMGLETAGKQLTDDQMERLMNKVDPDGLGEVDFAEFVSFMSQAQEGKGGADEFLDEPEPPSKPAHAPLPRDALLDGIEAFAAHHPNSSATHMLDLLRLQKTNKLNSESVQAVFTQYLERALQTLPELNMGGDGDRLLDAIRNPQKPADEQPRASASSLIAKLGAPPVNGNGHTAPGSEIELRDSPMYAGLDGSSEALVERAMESADARILI